MNMENQLLVTDELVEIEKYPVETTSSKLWKDLPTIYEDFVEHSSYEVRKNWKITTSSLFELIQ